MQRYLKQLVTCLSLAIALAACGTSASGALAGDGGNDIDAGTLGDTAADALDTLAEDTVATDAGCKVGGACGQGEFCNGSGICCPAFGCNPQCPNGVKRDAKGCDTCECKPAGACASHFECGKSQLCAKPASQCGGTGECKPIPTTCPMPPTPTDGVCGCDGKQYGDACSAAKAGLNVDHAGLCQVAKSCNPLGMGPGALCPSTEFCSLPNGQCSSSQGICTTKPQACPEEYAPVCGCDGKTYGSACSAAALGVNWTVKGECKPTSSLSYFLSCGNPVCGTQWQPTDGVPLCSSEKAGDPCSVEGQTCDAKAGCGQFLVCAKADPKLQGCPISKAKYKSDVRYLDAAERRRLAGDLLDTRLATYRYTATGAKGMRHLGFLIDDQPDSPAVDARRDMVDLYGYLSMAVATLQEQQQQIEQLRQALHQVRTRTGPAAMCR